jgi:hypothetical protein
MRTENYERTDPLSRGRRWPIPCPIPDRGGAVVTEGAYCFLIGVGYCIVLYLIGGFLDRL